MRNDRDYLNDRPLGLLLGLPVERVEHLVVDEVVVLGVALDEAFDEGADGHDAEAPAAESSSAPRTSVVARPCAGVARRGSRCA